MLINLLESVVDSTVQNNVGGDWWVWLIILVPFVILLVFNYFSSKKRTEQAEVEKQRRNAIQPGYILVTIGGIVGTVVSVNEEEGSFILQTGDEEHPTFLKLDKVAIYSWEDPNAPKEEEVSEETTETVEGEVFEESTETVEGEVFEEQTETTEEVAPHLDENTDK